MCKFSPISFLQTYYNVHVPTLKTETIKVQKALRKICLLCSMDHSPLLKAVMWPVYILFCPFMVYGCLIDNHIYHISHFYIHILFILKGTLLVSINFTLMTCVKQKDQPFEIHSLLYMHCQNNCLYIHFLFEMSHTFIVYVISL